MSVDKTSVIKFSVFGLIKRASNGAEEYVKPQKQDFDGIPQSFSVNKGGDVL